ncbi:MAG TPA: hypothetical protein VM286_00365 [Candidatus Thermoplasmatota archaeon]|nr:hypothetical protein [Candidatus Thermoplasmatota archaeon]
MRRAPVLLASAMLVAVLLSGCGEGPADEVTGTSSLQFLERPLGAVRGAEVEWSIRLRNADNATSAPARVHLAITPKALGMAPRAATEASLDVAPIPPHGTFEGVVRTPYQGPGDYSGTAEVRVGARVVARAFVFFEQCQMQAC